MRLVLNSIMRLFLPFIAVCPTLLLALAIAQPAVQAARQRIERSVASIDRKASRLKKIEKNVYGTDEGGHLTAWHDGNGFLKVKLWLGLSVNNRETIYYFHNKQLIYVQEQNQYFVWDEAREILDRSKPGHRTTANYYFQNRKLVYSTDTDNASDTITLLARAASALRMAAAQGKNLSIHDF